MKQDYLRVFVLAFATAILASCAGGPEEIDSRDMEANLVVDAGQRLTSQPKYNMTLGVMVMRDERATAFYADSDDFFRQPVPTGLSRSLYFSLSRSGLFSNVEFINEVPPSKMNVAQLREIGEHHDVDMLLVADLNMFNLVRRSLVEDLTIFGGPSTARETQEDFQTTLTLDYIGQILHVPDGAIVWGEQVRNFETVYALEGTLQAQEFNQLTEKVLTDSFSQLANFVNATGLIPQ